MLSHISDRVTSVHCPIGQCCTTSYRPRAAEQVPRHWWSRRQKRIIANDMRRNSSEIIANDRSRCFGIAQLREKSWASVGYRFSSTRRRIGFGSWSSRRALLILSVVFLRKSRPLSVGGKPDGSCRLSRGPIETAFYWTIPVQ